VLRGRQTIDRRTAATPLYLAAEDIATHAGVQQGLILAPKLEHRRAEFPTDGSHISVAQAADFIGISRAAVYKAINAGTLQALKIGNLTVVNRHAAVVYRERREKSGFASASDELEDREHAGIENPLTLARGSKAKAARRLGLTARKASAAKTTSAEK
jgi:excisionase family DNA binding protein